MDTQGKSSISKLMSIQDITQIAQLYESMEFNENELDLIKQLISNAEEGYKSFKGQLDSLGDLLSNIKDIENFKYKINKINPSIEITINEDSGFLYIEW